MRIDRIEVSAYTIPTDYPESDGTLEWRSTTIVIVQVHSLGKVGTGFSYTAAAASDLIAREFAPFVVGADPMAIRLIWSNMRQAVRNLGRGGIASSAISAVDSALWDLKARIMNVSLGNLLGSVRDVIPVYGSGGFTSYSPVQLQRQLSTWVGEGVTRVKIKVGRDARQDGERVMLARKIVGPSVELFVDADGAYTPKQALRSAQLFASAGVTWFEDPVPSDDIDGLRLVREHAPVGMEIAAGGRGHDSIFFQRLLSAGAVDVLQADATRCQGITGFLDVGTVAASYGVPFSACMAPLAHLDACCAMTSARHLEYFHDHARIEPIFFEGVIQPVNGALRPDRNSPGNGLVFRRADVEKYAA